MNDEYKVKRISTKEMDALIKNFEDENLRPFLRGKFFSIRFEDGDPVKQVFTAADNTSGECFVEEFDTEEKAVYWLENDVDLDDVEDKFDEGKRDKKDEKAGFKDFIVRCEEILSVDVLVRAKSKKEAEDIADDAFGDGLVEIDWDNVESTDCKVVEEVKIGECCDNYYCYRRAKDGNGVEEF